MERKARKLNQRKKALQKEAEGSHPLRHLLKKQHPPEGVVDVEGKRQRLLNHRKQRAMMGHLKVNIWSIITAIKGQALVFAANVGYVVDLQSK